MLALWNNLNSFDLFDKMFDRQYNSFGIESKSNDDGSLVVSLDLPGIKEENISIELTKDSLLTVKGERKTETSSYSVSESFTIDKRYDLDNLKAELSDGVLTIKLEPKQLKASEEVKKIPISCKK